MNDQTCITFRNVSAYVHQDQETYPPGTWYIVRGAEHRVCSFAYGYWFLSRILLLATTELAPGIHHHERSVKNKHGDLLTGCAGCWMSVGRSDAQIRIMAT